MTQDVDTFPFTYDKLLRRAHNEEMQGVNLAAATSYERAARATTDHLEMAVAYQGAGINYRIAGRLNYADMSFERAAQYALRAKNEMLSAGIERDHAMVFIDRKSYDRALTMLRRALSTFTRYEIMHQAAATRGFIARCQYCMSLEARLPDESKGLRQEALANYSHADATLLRRLRIARQARDGEMISTCCAFILNNRIWWLKALRTPRRQRLALKTFRLARLIGYNRRAIEALILSVPIIGIKWYEYLKVQHLAALQE